MEWLDEYEKLVIRMNMPRVFLHSSGPSCAVLCWRWTASGREGCCWRPCRCSLGTRNEPAQPAALEALVAVRWWRAGGATASMSVRPWCSME